MGSFGEGLRQAREARKITLQEIAATTKISCRALQALEDEHFSQLPGGIFNKGFVRAYARYVGLDEQKTLADYMAAAKLESTDTDLQVMSSQVAVAAAGRARDSGMNGTTLAGIVALIVGIALGGVWLREHRKEARELAAAATSSASQAVGGAAAQPPMTAPGAPSTGPGAAGDADAKTGAGAAQNAAQSAGQSTAQAAATTTAQPEALKAEAVKAGAAGEQAAPVEVSISATQRAWISVRSDGKTLESLTMDPDDPELRSRSYKAKQKLTLVVGNLGGLTVTYNGKAAGSLGAVGQAAKITFTPQGMQLQ